MHEDIEKSSQIDGDGWIVIDELELASDGIEGVHSDGSHHLGHAEQPYNEESLRVHLVLFLVDRRQ